MDAYSAFPYGEAPGNGIRVKALPRDLRLEILEELTREPSSLLVGTKLGVRACVVLELRAKMVRTGSLET